VVLFCVRKFAAFIVMKGIITMATKGKQTNAERRAVEPKGDVTPADFDFITSGDFSDLSGQIVQNIGVVAAATTSGGGYFGLSTTDDGGSCRLAVRHGSLVLDRRFYRLTDLESALAYCIRKLREFAE
jgi:hypothetical protein